MNPSITAAVRRRFDWGWLALAAAAHAMLLAVPWQRATRPVTAPQPVPVILAFPAPRPTATPTPPTVPDTAPPPVPSPAREPAAAEAAVAATPAGEADPPRAGISLAPEILLRQARARERASVRRPTRVLGEPAPYQPAWNGVPGTRLDGFTVDRPAAPALPASARVVDRWQGADGARHVTVELPGGERLCGRAEASDPVRPLVEHVMMFRSCGQRPTFTMPDDRIPARLRERP